MESMAISGSVRTNVCIYVKYIEILETKKNHRVMPLDKTPLRGKTHPLCGTSRLRVSTSPVSHLIYGLVRTSQRTSTNYTCLSVV